MALCSTFPVCFPFQGHTLNYEETGLFKPSPSFGIFVVIDFAAFNYFVPI